VMEKLHSADTRSRNYMMSMGSGINVSARAPIVIHKILEHFGVDGHVRFSRFTC
jgi:hypothetical protein